MKKISVALLVLVAGSAASPAAAQDGRQPGPILAARPWLRHEAGPTRPQPTAQPVCYCPAGRSVDVAGLASTIVGTVQMARWLRTHPELLPPAGAYSQPEALDYRSRPAHGASAATTGRFGLKAGLNLATVTGTRDLDMKYVAGLSAGFMADFGLSEHFSFHPELLYAQKGAKGSVTDPSGFGLSEEERLHYLDLPLLLRAKASGFFFEAGPQLGYLMAQKTKFVTTIPGLDPAVATTTGTDGTRRLDVGYVLGLGYALPQGWEIGVRYNGGLADVQDPSSDPKLRNSVFQLQAGYLF